MTEYHVLTGVSNLENTRTTLPVQDSLCYGQRDNCSKGAAEQSYTHVLGDQTGVCEQWPLCMYHYATWADIAQTYQKDTFKQYVKHTMNTIPHNTEGYIIKGILNCGCIPDVGCFPLNTHCRPVCANNSSNTIQCNPPNFTTNTA